MDEFLARMVPFVEEGVSGAVELARQRGWAIRMLDLRTSGDIAGDPTRVVGYGAFAIAGG